eukprot:EG_transcript_7763
MSPLDPCPMEAPEFEEVLAEARAIVRQAVQEYGLDGLGLSYNGGKDSVVMLSLVREVIGPEGLRHLRLCFQFAEDDPFPEMAEFIARSAAEAGMELHTLQCRDFRTGLQEVADRGVRAVFMGTRKTDPDGKYLRHFTPCSPGWPPLVRICPILRWSYHDVWRYIHDHHVPYCSLYDRGYTSIGTQGNTVPNPQLLDEETGSHRPAFALEDGAAERVGRLRRETVPKGAPVGEACVSESLDANCDLHVETEADRA